MAYDAFVLEHFLGNGWKRAILRNGEVHQCVLAAWNSLIFLIKFWHLKNIYLTSIKLLSVSLKLLWIRRDMSVIGVVDLIRKVLTKSFLVLKSLRMIPSTVLY